MCFMNKCNGVAIITGGSGAIGEALVREFAPDYTVCFTYLTQAEKAHSIAENCGAEAIRCDVTDSNDVNRMVEQAATLGKIRLLINNAGIAEQSLFQDITDERWRRMMAVNLDGAFFCARAVLPGMIREKNGLIINISTIWGRVGGACEVHYSTAKAGLIGMTKALAREVGLSNVRVNCIAPGAIAGGMNEIYDLEDLKELSMLNKVGAGADVALAARYLERAGFVTGTVLEVDGGLVY
jgi:3-oxoacyl-[acyl-carrier protein] reductase